MLLVVIGWHSVCYSFCVFFFFQAEDGIRDAQESRGLGDVYKRQAMWGGWLADLGNNPSIEGASVTVESAPDSGLRLRLSLIHI